MNESPLSQEDFEALAAFRTGLRRFVRFSEHAARQAGLTPQQHQLLVAAKGHPGPTPPLIGELAEALQIKHHSAVELVNRVQSRGLVEREHSPDDNRAVFVNVTAAGEDVLQRLTAAHRAEVRQLEIVLRQLTARFAHDQS